MQFQIFSTPEIHIGFHPDAAASFYLSHLTGHVGKPFGIQFIKLCLWLQSMFDILDETYLHWSFRMHLTEADPKYSPQIG